MRFVKIMFRNLGRNKSYSAILTGSLSIGMAAVIVIALVVRTERNFDGFHKKGDQIYRVTTRVKNPSTGELRHFASTMPPVARLLKNEYPQIEEAVRFRRSANHIVTYNDRRFFENKVLFVDSGFFRIFSFELVKGNEATALLAPNSVVLTETTAKKYFGEEEPVGKLLKVDSMQWQVTGIIRNIPADSHIQPDMLVSFATWKIPPGYPVDFDSWTWVTFPTYVLLKADTDVEAIRRDMQRFVKKYAGDDVASRRQFELQPLKDMYFSSELLGNDTFKTGDQRQSGLLTVIAILILVIGAFNFMTLFTASAVKRAKEIGLRKVVGAVRARLIVQLIGEAVFLSFLCIPLALVISSLSARWLSGILDFPLVYSRDEIIFSAGICSVIALVIGLAAGIYPALKLTAHTPSVTLRNLFKLPSGISFKKALVVTQFSISTLLILAVLAMWKQSFYISKKELGFGSSHLLRISVPGEQLERKYEFLKNELHSMKGVEQVTKAGNLFAEALGSVPVYPDRTGNRDLAIAMNIHGVHYDFFETFGVDFLYGRPVSKAFSSDSADAIVINEAAMKAFGWKENPVGRQLQIGDIKHGTIVGVAKDFHFRSLHTAIGPLVMYLPPTRLDNIFIKTRPGELFTAVREIEDSWNRLAGEIPLDLSFAGDNIGQLYRKDQQFMQLVLIFCSLSIFVACIGLYALTMLIAGQRVREIAVRKVLGAGTAGLTLLLSREFLVMTGIAVCIASPVAWYFINRWLNGFAYRVSLDWSMFFIAGLIVLLLALLTVSFQAIKAAVANPVKSLRTE